MVVVPQRLEVSVFVDSSAATAAAAASAMALAPRVRVLGVLGRYPHLGQDSSPRIAEPVAHLLFGQSTELRQPLLLFVRWIRILTIGDEPLLEDVLLRVWKLPHFPR